MGKLADAGGVSALCLRFAILTAARSGEARAVRWNEIDLAGKVWTVPGEKMKAKAEHRVPLSDCQRRRKNVPDGGVKVYQSG